MIKILNKISNHINAIQFLYIIIVATSGIYTTYLARYAPIFKDYGLLVWYGIGITVAILMSLTLYILSLANKKSKEAEYFQSMALKKSSINPLSESFENLVIQISDLYLPHTSLHENKIFKNCRFVGQGCLGITGGTISHNKFTSCGDMVPFPPDTSVVGLPVLQNCTIKNCDFYQITIFSPQAMINQFTT